MLEQLELFGHGCSTPALLLLLQEYNEKKHNSSCPCIVDSCELLCCCGTINTAVPGICFFYYTAAVTVKAARVHHQWLEVLFALKIAHVRYFRGFSLPYLYMKPYQVSC